jgi:hypothetical protein
MGNLKLIMRGSNVTNLLKNDVKEMPNMLFSGSRQLIPDSENRL